MCVSSGGDVGVGVSTAVVDGVVVGVGCRVGAGLGEAVVLAVRVGDTVCVTMLVADGVDMTEAVNVGVAAGGGVLVAVALADCVGVAVCVGVPVGDTVGVCVGVPVWVLDGDGVTVKVGAEVGVRVAVPLRVAVAVRVGVPLRVAVRVRVGHCGSSEQVFRDVVKPVHAAPQSKSQLMLPPTALLATHNGAGQPSQMQQGNTWIHSGAAAQELDVEVKPSQVAGQSRSQLTPPSTPLLATHILPGQPSQMQQPSPRATPRHSTRESDTTSNLYAIILRSPAELVCLRAEVYYG